MTAHVLVSLYNGTDYIVGPFGDMTLADNYKQRLLKLDTVLAAVGVSQIAAATPMYATNSEALFDRIVDQGKRDLAKGQVA